MSVLATRLSMVGVFIVISLILMGQSLAKMDTASIVGLWLFDEKEGDTAKDASGNGHDGQIGGQVKWVSGQFGSALEFPGVNLQWVTIPPEDSLNLEHWTITAWIKTEDQGRSWQGILAKATWPPETRNYNLGLIANTQVPRNTFTSGNSESSVAGKSSLSDGDWHHVAATYDQEIWRVYVDGNLEGEKVFSSKPDRGDFPLVIGGLRVASAAEAYKGIIDDVGLFNKAATENDINAIRTQGLESMRAAVSPVGKLANRWGRIKRTGKFE